MKHFKLRKDLIKDYFGKTLYRIEAIIDSKWAKKGDLGGYIEKESNLSGEAWVSDNALVYGNARVYDNVLVFGSARVYGEAQVYGNARVCGYARVFGNARVCDNSLVYDNARVFGNALVTKTPTTIAGLKHNITLTETHIFIGCEGHTIKHWEKEIKNIGKKHNYTDKEIEGTILMLKGALMQRGY
jgi:UDP-3-O-[3-hydroxymyristoyl] glucosamine N-acyltransferase